MSRRMWPTPTAGDSFGSRNATARRPNGNGRHHAGETLLDALILNGDMEMPPTGVWPGDDACPPSEACSPASAASTSALSAPDGPDAGRSNGTPTASTSSPTTGPMFPDMETSAPSTEREVAWWPTPDTMTHRSGHTVRKALKGRHGLSLHHAVAAGVSSRSISSPAVSPASRGAWPGSDGEPRTIVGSGPSSSEPFASYDPATSSWRTSQGSWLEEEAWGLSSEDWPRSGMTRSGTVFRQAPSAPLTGGTASGSSDTEWPTPVARDRHTIAKVTRGAGSMAAGQERIPPLAVAVMRASWPTPTSHDHKDTGDSVANGTVPVNGLLGRAVGPTTAGGALNPTWVEWLMGFPLGWTDCEHWATPSFRKSLKSSAGG